MNPLLQVLFFLLLSCSLSADYQTGLDAYLKGHYATAITEWQAVVESPPGTVPEAERAETLYAIGMLFWLGQGVEQDTFESASWLQLAAELNHPGAQNKLGFLYSAGQGVKQSDFEAFKWWHLAANQGDADAQYNLGVLYRDGLGVGPDPEESMKWFREAASNGDPVSIGIVKQDEGDTGTAPVPGTQSHRTVDDYAAELNRIAGSGNMELDDAPQLEAVDEYAAGEDWIDTRDPEHYTIQVIALSQPDNLHEFIEQQPGLAPFAIYRPSGSKGSLWVLVQGDYPDVNAARLALQTFPETMQVRKKLWIRRFEMVQSLLE